MPAAFILVGLQITGRLPAVAALCAHAAARKARPAKRRQATATACPASTCSHCGYHTSSVASPVACSYVKPKMGLNARKKWHKTLNIT